MICFVDRLKIGFRTEIQLISAGNVAMTDKIPTNQRYRTLSSALEIIDPEGLLTPGTKAHNWATETVLSWMAQMEPKEVFRMAENAQNIFKWENDDGRRLHRFMQQLRL
jgi:hypothetical protein